MIIQILARESRQFLVRKDTPRGSIVTMADNAPKWFAQLVQDAHGQMLPDDWKYQCIQCALDDFAECEDPEDVIANLEEDIETHSLLKWLGSSNLRVGYCDDAADEWGIEPESDILRRIGLGQRFEKIEVYNSVLWSLQTQVELLGA